MITYGQYVLQSNNPQNIKLDPIAKTIIFSTLTFFKNCGKNKSATNPTIDENEIINPINQGLPTDS